MKVLKGLLYVIVFGASLALLLVTVEYRRFYQQLEADRNPVVHGGQVVPAVKPAQLPEAPPVAKVEVKPPAPEPPKAVAPAPVKPTAKVMEPAHMFAPNTATPMVQAVDRTPHATPYHGQLLVSWQYQDQAKPGVHPKPLLPGVYWHPTLGKVVVYPRRR